MQPTISIPRNWPYPRFSLGQQTQQGLIVGIEYYLPNGLPTKKCNGSWRYAVLNSQKTQELSYLTEEDIELSLP